MYLSILSGSLFYLFIVCVCITQHRNGDLLMVVHRLDNQMVHYFDDLL